MVPSKNNRITVDVPFFGFWGFLEVLASLHLLPEHRGVLYYEYLLLFNSRSMEHEFVILLEIGKINQSGYSQLNR